MYSNSANSVSVSARICLWIFSLILLSTASVFAQAQDNAPVFDQYTISASARAEVVNDLLKAELAVEHEDRDSAALANRVNADMTWALEQVRRFPAITARSGNYNTWPQYERKQNKIIGWRSQQMLKLESDDFDAARKAIKVLQAKLQVRGMQLSPKSETRESAEDDLIADALNAFRQRASLVQSTMGANSYRVMQVDINTNSTFHHVARMASYAESAVSTRRASEPAIEAGTSEVTVMINGSIQLQ